MSTTSKQRWGRRELIRSACSFGVLRPKSKGTRPRGTNAISNHGLGMQASTQCPLSTRTMITAAKKRSEAAIKNTKLTTRTGDH